MALSRTEIVKRSEAKSGIKAKTFKLPLALIAEIEQLATTYNLSQRQLIAQAITAFKEKHQ